MDRTKRTYPRRLLSLLLAWLLCISCVQPAFAASETAKTVQLMKTEGTVSVTNSSGKSVSLRDSMRLYNGYQVATNKASYAWFNLDSSKLSKLDEVSGMELRKSGKKLELLLNSGNLFFNVTEPLEEDETLNIRTSTMVVGIRGTCGWVEVIDQWHSRVRVLEGRVTCSVTDPVTGQTKTTVLTGGEWAECVVYPQDRSGDKCDIIRQRFTEEDIPGFVLVELVGDGPLCEKIYADSGLDLRNLTQAQALEKLRADQAAMAEKLGESQRAQEVQERNVSTDPVWTPEEPSAGTGNGGGREPADTDVPATPETPASGITSTTPITTRALTMTMPVTIPQIQAALNPANVSSVTVLPDPTGANNDLIQNAGEPLNVAAGKTLTLNAPINLETNDQTTVDGTMRVNGDLTNNGTIIVTSPNSLHVTGRFINNGTVDNRVSGHIEAAQGITNNGAIHTSGNAVLESSAAATVTMAGAGASLSLNGGSISNTGAGNALRWENGESPSTYITATSTTNIWTTGDAPLAVVIDGIEQKNPALDGYKVVTNEGQTSLRPTGGVEGGVLVDPVTVSFDANGGRWSGTAPSITVERGQPMGAVSQAPTREDYTFLDWRDANDVLYTESSIVNGDITLYARWQYTGSPENPEEETVTVTFMNEGTVYASITIEKGGALPYLPAAPERAGYVFTGWSGLQDVYNEDATITAQWQYIEPEENEVTVTFMNEGAVYASITIEKGGALPYLPAAPERAGYVFTGWSGLQDVYNEDATITAQWQHIEPEENEVTITFMNEGTVYASITIEKGGALPYLPAAPTAPEGKVFDGWEGIQDTYGADATITALWQEDSGTETVTVTFHVSSPVDDPEEPEDSVPFALQKGQALNYPPMVVDVYSGYMVTQWTRTQGGEDYYNDWAQGVESDLDLYAVWEKIELEDSGITVTYDANSGEFPSSGNGEAVFHVSDADQLAQLARPEDPYRGDAYFLGWAPKKLGDISDWKALDIGWSDEEPDTYYAVWLAGEAILLPASISTDILQDILNQTFVGAVGIEASDDDATLTIDEDLIIPDGKELVLIDGVGMVVDNEATLTNYGTVDVYRYDLGSVRAVDGVLEITNGGVCNMGTLSLPVICNGGGLVNAGSVSDVTLEDGKFAMYSGKIGDFVQNGGNSYLYGGSLNSAEITGGKMEFDGAQMIAPLPTALAMRSARQGELLVSGENVDVDIYSGYIYQLTIENGDVSVSGGTIRRVSVDDGELYISGGLIEPDWGSPAITMNGGTVTIGGDAIIRSSSYRGVIDYSGGTLNFYGGTVWSTRGDGYAVYCSEEGEEDEVVKPDIHIGGGSYIDTTFIVGTDYTSPQGIEVPTDFDTTAFIKEELADVQENIRNAVDAYNAATYESEEFWFYTCTIPAILDGAVEAVNNAIAEAKAAGANLPDFKLKGIAYQNLYMEGIEVPDGAAPDIFTVTYTLGTGTDDIMSTTSTRIDYSLYEQNLPEDIKDALNSYWDNLTAAIDSISDITIPNITLPTLSYDGYIPAGSEITGIDFDPTSGKYVITCREARPGIFYGSQYTEFPGYNDLYPWVYWHRISYGEEE